MILNIGGGGGLPIRLIVTAPTGSAVSVTQGTTVLAANEVDGVWTFAIPSLGVWTIHATIEGQSLTQDVDISKVGQYNVTLEKPIKATLNDNDWATIKSVADESKGANYWAVGDTKQITINGKVSDGLTLDNYSTWVYIIGFDHNKDVEGTGIAFGGFKTAQANGTDICLCDWNYNIQETSGQWFNMNNSMANSGGWKNSRMRSTTLPLVKSAFPSELTSVLKTTSIYSDNTGGGSTAASNVTATQDELYLLAEFEISGERLGANAAEQNYQKQYAYYAAGNSKVKYRHDSTTAYVVWRERSVFSFNDFNFCVVAADGTSASAGANYSMGLAPAFKVGGAKYTPLEYIASSGTQYIDTGYIPNQDTRVYAECVLPIASGSTQALFGSRVSSSSSQYQFVTQGGYYRTDYNTTINNFTQTSFGDTKFYIDKNKNITDVNGQYNIEQTYGTFTCPGNMYIFATNNNGSVYGYASAKLYVLKIYDNDVLIRDFIPAKDEIGNAGLFDKVEEKFYYNAGTGSFGIPGARYVTSVPIGNSVYCEENGTRTEFIVVHQGNPDISMYDSSCDGTWVVRKDCYNEQAWSANNNRWQLASLQQWLRDTYIGYLNISDNVKQVKIPHAFGLASETVYTGANGLASKVFLLSAVELGFATKTGVPILTDGTKLDYFNQTNEADPKRVAKFNGTAAAWWTRSPEAGSTNGVVYVETGGTDSNNAATATLGVRPAFILSSTTYVDSDNNLLTAPPYNTISTLNVGDSVFFNVGGVKTEYIIVHKGNPDETIYDASCDGVWAVCKNIPNNSLAWRSMPYVIYSDSLARSWPNTTYYNTIDSGIKQYIKTAKLPYTTYSGGNFVSYNMANGMEQNCFLLSWVELGGSVAYPNTNRSSDGAALSYFSGQPDSIRIAKYGNNATYYWTRSVWKSVEDMALAVSYSGDGPNLTCTTQIGMRPALIFDNNTPIDSSNNIIA